VSGDPHFRDDDRSLGRRVANMIQRGVVTSVDDGLMMQALDLRMKDGYRPTKVEHWHPYGMSYHPQVDAEVLTMALGGNPDHLIAMPGADRRYRMKNLAPGEFAIHDDQGQKFHFKRGGVELESAKGIKLKGPITIEGDVTHTGNYNQSGVHVDSNGPHTA
jgi:phage baseplate assembly protein V